MNFILFICIFFTFNGWCYAPKDIRLSDFEFSRYVRPQLISISQDYSTLITSLNIKLKPFKRSNQEIREIHELGLDLKSLDSEKVLKSLKSMNEKLEKLITDFSSVPERDKETQLSADDLLTINKNFTELNRSLFKLYMKIDNLLSFPKEEIIKNINAYELERETLELEVQFHLTMISMADNRFSQDFSRFWMAFLKPVTQQILPNSDKNLFIRKLNDLNLTFNMLNVVLTKRNKPINKQATAILKTIHRRWNNILKVTLR